MNPSSIIGIQFGIMSPEQIRKASVAHITTKDTYINNKPVVGGIFDPRMGVLEPGILCPTDGENYIDCPGYFGHLDLAKPVFYIQYISTIIKILRCVCIKCSKLLIDKGELKHLLKYNTKQRWDKVFEIADKVKRCGDHNKDGCGFVKPNKIRKDGLATIIATWMRKVNDEMIENTMKLLPEDIAKIFKRITNEDVNMMGFSSRFSRPEWMICYTLAVPPPCVRPSVKHDAQQRSEDDLSNIIISIIKANQSLQDKLNQNANEMIIDNLRMFLQYNIATLINNKIPGINPMAQRSSGRLLKSVADRLNGKTGRIRGNLMGKRVDFSARSVITGDPNLSIRELGVPLKIAMNITYPAVVNKRNKMFLLRLVRNGPETYPGAKVLERNNGEHISLRYIDRNSLTLNEGDIVHRHIIDGDPVLFNRQPTLHRMSMMCHIVRVMKKGNTFRMNVADTKPYNADFDGDEMNMHMPQSPEAAYEIQNIAAVPRHIMSPASNSSIIGIFQDSLLGLFQFTRENVTFNDRDAMNLLVHSERLQPKKLKRNFKNTDILSQILPPFTLQMPNQMFNNDDNNPNNIIDIKNGNMLKGQMDKSVKNIIHSIYNDFGHEASSQFIDDLQFIVTEYMKNSSYSVGISDLIANDKVRNDIKGIIRDNITKVDNIYKETLLGVFQNNTGQTNAYEFEGRVTALLDKTRDSAGSIGRKSLDANNRFVIMVNAGSKGSNINIAQMISCLGQQMIDSKRIPYGFESRTLPHYKKYNDSPEARGFVKNSFIKGLTPQELFFHAMGGRVGLIDTAVKTSQTGYIQRRLIKGMEDLKIDYDMTVRNNMYKVIQFRYGDDGIDPIKIEKQKIPFLHATLEDIYAHFHLPIDGGLIKSTFTAATLRKHQKEKEEFQQEISKVIQRILKSRDNIVSKVFDYGCSKEVYVPVKFTRIIENIRHQLKMRKNTMVNVTPLECLKIVGKCKQDLLDIKMSPPTELFFVLMDYYMTPHNLLVMKHYTRDALNMLCVAIKTFYKKAIVAPGEMVGMISAQSIGEPTTQMTLNTFHFAGVSSKSNVTRGVPRIEEILSLSKSPKSESITVFMKEHEQENLARAKQLKYMMENTILRNVVSSVSIVFDPNDAIEEDQVVMEQFHVFEEMMEDCIGSNSSQDDDMQLSKWVIRFELNKEVMLEQNITMDEIHFAVKMGYSDEIDCVFSDYNENNLVFRVRLNESLKKKDKKTVTLDQSDEIYKLKSIQEHMLDNIILKGVKNIKKVYLRNIKTNVVKENNTYKNKDIWVLDTVGTNLLQVLSLPYIDTSKTYSNNIIEMYSVLGIEATRDSIYREIMEVLEFDGSYINSHHVSLLCDRMCVTARLVSIYRHGINNDNIGPIAKASFEETTEMFLRAARHAECDTMRGVSANIMCGQEGNFGTSAFQVYLNTEEVNKYPPKQEDNKEDYEDIDSIFNVEDPNQSCSIKQLTIHQPNITKQDTQQDTDYNPGF